MSRVPPQPTPKIAENGARWPSLAHLLAPGVGCDCQMMAIMMADGLATPDAPKPPKR